MKTSILKRLQSLEQAATAQATRQIVLIEIMEMAERDREAYWAGDEEILRQYGGPILRECAPGLIHTIVIDVHPACRTLRDSADGVDEGDG